MFSNFTVQSICCHECNLFLKHKLLNCGNIGAIIEGKGGKKREKELFVKSQTNVVFLELVERVTILKSPGGGGKKDNKMFNNG